MRREFIVMVDDLDGAERLEDDVQPVEFGVLGTNFMLDLSKVNREKLVAALKEFIAAAQKTSRGKVSPELIELLGEGEVPKLLRQRAAQNGSSEVSGRHTREELDRLQDWLAKHSLAATYSYTGRKPAAVWQAFREDNPGLLRQSA